MDTKNLSSVYGDNTEMQTQPETENLGFSIELTVTTCTNSLTLFSVMSDPLGTHGLLGSGSATEFSRQEYWSGLPFPPPGDLPNPGIGMHSWASLASPALAGRFFYH